MSHLDAGISLISLIVDNYDTAISFFTTALNFTLTEDKPDQSSKTGEPKRWVTMHRLRPDGSSALPGLLIAQAADDAQRAVVGKQWAGRVGLFLHVEDFESEFARMESMKVEFLSEPRVEVYGKVVVFRDVCGNKWDLIQRV